MKLFNVIVPLLLVGSLAARSSSEETFGPFGIGNCHVNGRSTEDNARWIPQMEAIGIKFCRSGNTSWSAIEPIKGQWNWQPLDEQLNYLAEHGFSFGGILLGNPQWNANDQPGTLPVNNLSGWSRYVSAIVQHTGGKVKHWEVWNEPPNFTGEDQTPADYAQIVTTAYDAAKAADPDCMIGLAARSADVNYLEQAIQAGAKDHFDFITLHPYEVLGGIVDNVGTEPLFMHIVPTVRKMLAAQNPDKVDVPIFFTELGCDLNKGAEAQAHALIKAYTLSIAQGVSCLHWFEGMDGDSGPMGLLDQDANPRPAYTALEQMIDRLGQHPNYLGWIMLNSKHYGFVFQGTKTTVLVIWEKTGSADVVDFGKTMEIVNPTTGNLTRAESYELTTAPIFVLEVSEELQSLARANKTKPLPWGDDYSKAKSVSITMEASPIEKGLHTLSTEEAARGVIRYGGSARAGGVPGGNLFVVNPEFLSYETEPIEITAVVRRNEQNDDSGFKLVYESTDGFKTAGDWYTVPDNKQWHTVSWKIDDPQFVGYWGYNFSLNSDGDQYDTYYIKSVTVTKSAK